jgi:nicotinate dehydrogenase subunit B
MRHCSQRWRAIFVAAVRTGESFRRHDERCDSPKPAMADPSVAIPELPADVVGNPVLSRWVRLARDGCIEVYAGKVELGQGIWTTQLQIAADELDVKPSAIRLRVGDTAVCPDQGTTVGSQSTEVGAMALRRICAEVRQLFVRAAAQRLSVSVGRGVCR